MQNLILTLHIIVCVLLVILVLLQSGKEGMGVIFGGGNSSVFGSTGAGGILAKLTTLMAIIFVITSLSYTYVTSSHTETESQILNVQIEDTPPATQTPGVQESAPSATGEPAQPAEAKDATPAPAQPEAREPAQAAPVQPATGSQEAVPAQSATPQAEPRQAN